jgi:putative flippase GtrA
MRALASFAVVGGIGFVIDFLVLTGLLLCGIGPLLARVPAVATALVVTWLLNRRFTFQAKRAPSAKELLGYSSVAGVSALINYALYSGMVLAGVHPMLALPLATIATMFLNFVGFKKLVFRRP